MRGMQTQLPGNRLGELVEKSGRRLVHVAAHCDVDQSTVYRWREGLTAIPDDQKLRLAAYFEVSVPYLMGWDEGVSECEAA